MREALIGIISSSNSNSIKVVKMSSNPITSWIKSTMETYDDRESRMTDRVAETSINAQKISDEGEAPSAGYYQWKQSKSTKDNDHFYVAQSALKGKEEGYVNSFKAMRYYQDEAAKYRDELLKEVEQQQE